MNLRQQLSNASPDRETVITLGVFDGVHEGHRHLLQRLTQLAASSYLPTVLTFTNHPITVLRPGTQVGYITSHEHRVRLIKSLGIELVISLEFTPELAQVTAHEFTETLVSSLKMRGLVLGPDTALGHNREGTFEFLQQQGVQQGFWVEAVEPLSVDGMLVKSRHIRSAVSEGDVALCSQLLGRQFSLQGQVVVGDRRGRELGFPTANLNIPSHIILPGDGIYATWAIIDGTKYPSATSVGVRPTFGLSQRLVEVYVIDFDSDLYGKNICVEFVGKLRDQEAFSSVEELVVQIEQDVADSRKVLKGDQRTHVA